MARDGQTPQRMSIAARAALVLLCGALLLGTHTFGANVQEPGFPPGAFHIEVLTPTIEAEIAGRAGPYPMEDRVHLRILAPLPGWQLAVMATDLRLDANEAIAASEICLQTDGGATALLNQRQLVVQSGEPGETVIELQLVLVATERHEMGLYKGTLLIEAFPGQSATPEAVEIPFEATVRCQVQHVFEGSKMYFHFADLPGQLSATVRGGVSADATIQLSLSVSNGSINSLCQRKAYWGGAGSSDNSIPLTWKLGEGAGGPLREPDTRGSDGSAVSWRLEGTPGEIEYRLECTLSPEACQPAGDYGMEVILSVEPLL